MSISRTDTRSGKRSQNWSSILWREMRFSEDQEYASHLLELLVDKSLNGWGVLVMALLSAAIIGGLNALLFFLLQTTFLRPVFKQGSAGSWFLLMGLVIGGLIGAGLILDLKQQGKLSWRRVLPLLVSTAPIQIRHPLDWEAFYFKLVIAIGGWIGITTLKTNFGDFDDNWISFYAGLIGAYLIVAIIFGPSFQEAGCGVMAFGMIGLCILSVISCALTSNLFNGPNTVEAFWGGAIAGGLTSLLLSARAGKGLALRLGLPNSLILGILLGSIIVMLVRLQELVLSLETIRVWSSGLPFGIAGAGVGIYLGRGTGLDRSLKGQLILFVVGLATTSLVWSPAWLPGLFVGNIIGWFGQLFWPTRLLTLAEIYLHRHYYIWGFGPPSAPQVKAALQQASQNDSWLELLQQAEAPPDKAETVEDLVTTALLAEDWQKRFIARRKLVAMGGEAVPHLRKSLAKDIPLETTRMAHWILQSIIDDTWRRLARKAKYLICPQCFTYCGSHLLFLNHETVRYYGCRTCSQSRHFFDCSEGKHLIAVLDGAAKLVEIDPQGNIRVNWLARQTLFDFDQVEINGATDEQVERFAVQVGNDTDPARQGHYKQISCFINQPGLSDNSLRILKRLFGRVEILSFVPSSATLS